MVEIETVNVIPELWKRAVDVELLKRFVRTVALGTTQSASTRSLGGKQSAANNVVGEADLAPMEPTRADVDCLLETPTDIIADGKRLTIKALLGLFGISFEGDQFLAFGKDGTTNRRRKESGDELSLNDVRNLAHSGISTADDLFSAAISRILLAVTNARSDNPFPVSSRSVREGVRKLEIESLTFSQPGIEAIIAMVQDGRLPELGDDALKLKAEAAKQLLGWVAKDIKLGRGTWVFWGLLLQVLGFRVFNDETTASEKPDAKAFLHDRDVLRCVAYVLARKHKVRHPTQLARDRFPGEDSPLYGKAKTIVEGSGLLPELARVVLPVVVSILGVRRGLSAYEVWLGPAVETVLLWVAPLAMSILGYLGIAPVGGEAGLWAMSAIMAAVRLGFFLRHPAPLRGMNVAMIAFVPLVLLPLLVAGGFGWVVVLPAVAMDLINHIRRNEKARAARGSSEQRARDAAAAAHALSLGSVNLDRQDVRRALAFLLAPEVEGDLAAQAMGGKTTEMNPSHLAAFESAYRELFDREVNERDLMDMVQLATVSQRLDAGSGPQAHEIASLEVRMVTERVLKDHQALMRLTAGEGHFWVAESDRVRDALMARGVSRERILVSRAFARDGLFTSLDLAKLEQEFLSQRELLGGSWRCVLPAGLALRGGDKLGGDSVFRHAVFVFLAGVLESLPLRLKDLQNVNRVEEALKRAA